MPSVVLYWMLLLIWMRLWCDKMDAPTAIATNESHNVNATLAGRMLKGSGGSGGGGLVGSPVDEDVSIDQIQWCEKVDDVCGVVYAVIWVRAVPRLLPRLSHLKHECARAHEHAAWSAHAHEQVSAHVFLISSMNGGWARCPWKDVQSRQGAPKK